MDASTLASAMENRLSLSEYSARVDSFNEMLARSGCMTADRCAMLCAQVGEETGGLEWIEELASGEEYEGRVDLGNTHPGDGPRFKGRSWIQVTGRANYTALSRWAHAKGYVPTSTFFVDHPKELATIEYAGLGVVWYWTVARDMNAYADGKDIVGATRAVNGGTNGLADREQRWQHCLTLGSRLLPNGGDWLDMASARDLAKVITQVQHATLTGNGNDAVPDQVARVLHRQHQSAVREAVYTVLKRHSADFANPAGSH